MGFGLLEGWYNISILGFGFMGWVLVWFSLGGFCLVVFLRLICCVELIGFVFREVCCLVLVVVVILRLWF